MADLIQLRRDTKANWSTANPVLAIGEPGCETDTRRWKIGDGSTAWNSLDYFCADPVVLFSELDNFKDSDLRNNSTPSRYVVIDSVANKRKVGTLDVISDSFNHVVTQIFTTHEDYDDATGTIGVEGHHDDIVVCVYRSVKISGGTLPDINWTRWNYINDEILKGIEGGLEYMSFKDGVFNVSLYNADGDTLATYETLALALAVVPSNYQVGGMSIKFILRTNTGTEEEPVYTDEYVQYRLMTAAWSNNASDWQGVDDEPTAGSNNLTKSGGVTQYITETHGVITIKGAGSTLKQVDNIPVLSGHTYKVWLKDKNISIEGVTGYSILNIVLKRKDNSTVITRYAEVLLAGTLADYYIADIPTEYNDYTLTISIRSAVGTEQSFFIEDITETQELQEQITEVSHGLDGVVDGIYGNEGDYTEGAYLSNNLDNFVRGNISAGITPLIPAQVGDKVITHCGYSSGEPRYIWLYDSNKEPLPGMYYGVSSYRVNPLTITKDGTTYIRATFNMNADDVYISVNGVRVWEYQKKETGLTEWNYKVVGINKVIYGEGQYDCWKNGAVQRKNGAEFNSTVNSCTGFINIEDFYTIETIMSVIPSDYNKSDAAVCFYDKSGTFISSVESNYYGTEQSYETRVIDVPHGAKYIRLSVYNEFRQHWKLIGIRGSSIAGGTSTIKPQKVTLEFGNLDSNGQMKPYSSDFFDNARTSLYYSLQSVNLPYSYTIFVFNKNYSLEETISAQADTDYVLDPTKWHKIVINYTANSLPVKELPINLNVIDTSYNVIPVKTIKTFQYLVKYKRGRGLYSDGNVDYSEAYNMADNLISNTLRFYLPSNYSPTGEPVKLIYKAHGTGGYESIDLTTWGGDGSISYLADEGFALYDMFAGTSYYSAKTTNRIANYNLPIQLAAQKAAYEWVVRNFNVDPRIYVVGKSHGGLAGIYVTNNIVPTRAVALLAPLITQIADRYQPWGLTYVTETKMCLEDMCFIPPEGVSFDLMAEYVFQRTSSWKNILLSNLDKQVGLNPYINGVTNVSQEALLTALMNNEYQTLGGMDNLIRYSDVPVKVWCAVDDEQVLYANGYNWIKSLQNGGSNAQFRAYPTGHGRHSFDSFTSTDETIIKDNVVTALGVSYNAPRVYVEVVNFLNQF